MCSNNLGHNFLADNIKFKSDQLVLDFKELLEKNKKIIHLDVIDCKFSTAQVRSISQSLNKNTTILGFHFYNSQFVVDHQQFLIQQSQNIIKQFNFMEFKGMKRKNKVVIPNNYCWICDKFQPLSIKVKAAFSPATPVFVHLDYDNFKTYYLSEEDGEFLKIELMAPKDKVLGYFTDGI